MRKSILLTFALLLIAAPALAADFVNGGFENGNLNGWTGGGGNWSAYGDQGTSVYVPWTGGTLPTASQYAGGTPNNYIMGAGTDPITGANTVYNGSYSVRVNDNYQNYSVSTISQTVANYSNANIYFAWNAVLESSHGLSDSDYFALTLHDNTTNTDLVNRSYSSAGSVGAGTGNVVWNYYSGWYSAGWVVEQIALTPAQIGDSFTLTLLASDCPYGGHAGYVYLDGFGAAPPVQGVPEPLTMLLLGSGLVGVIGFGRKFRK